MFIYFIIWLTMMASTLWIWIVIISTRYAIVVETFEIRTQTTADVTISSQENIFPLWVLLKSVDRIDNSTSGRKISENEYEFPLPFWVRVDEEDLLETTGMSQGSALMLLTFPFWVRVDGLGGALRATNNSVVLTLPFHLEISSIDDVSWSGPEVQNRILLDDPVRSPRSLTNNSCLMCDYIILGIVVVTQIVKQEYKHGRQCKFGDDDIDDVLSKLGSTPQPTRVGKLTGWVTGKIITLLPYLDDRTRYGVAVVGQITVDRLIGHIRDVLPSRYTGVKNRLHVVHELLKTIHHNRRQNIDAGVNAPLPRLRPVNCTTLHKLPPIIHVAPYMIITYGQYDRPKEKPRDMIGKARRYQGVYINIVVEMLFLNLDTMEVNVSTYLYRAVDEIFDQRRGNSIPPVRPLPAPEINDVNETAMPLKKFVELDEEDTVIHSKQNGVGVCKNESVDGGETGTMYIGDERSVRRISGYEDQITVSPITTEKISAVELRIIDDNRIEQGIGNSEKEEEALNDSTSSEEIQDVPISRTGKFRILTRVPEFISIDLIIESIYSIPYTENIVHISPLINIMIDQILIVDTPNPPIRRPPGYDLVPLLLTPPERLSHFPWFILAPSTEDPLRPGLSQSYPWFTIPPLLDNIKNQIPMWIIFKLAPTSTFSRIDSYNLPDLHTQKFKKIPPPKVISPVRDAFPRWPTVSVMTEDADLPLPWPDIPWPSTVRKPVVFLKLITRDHPYKDGYAMSVEPLGNKFITH